VTVEVVGAGRFLDPAQPLVVEGARPLDRLADRPVTSSARLATSRVSGASASGV
jgi:hypothetical protein